MTDWTLDDARRAYAIDAWGSGFFAINDRGHVEVRPGGNESDAAIDLSDLERRLRSEGISTPVLIRFPDVLRMRLRAMIGAFEQAMDQTGYAGGYTPVYPIKVNQRKVVVEALVGAGAGSIGLEAGSKPELIAVLAYAPAGSTIVCNGYKDRAYIRMALIAERLGHQVYIVLEKLSELDLVIEQSRALGVTPRLGVRVRLATIGSGKWQNTGGAKAKFGLTAGQVIDVARRLEAAGLLDSLRMMHLHMGSQIANVRDIQRGMAEAIRLYADIVGLGAPLGVIDVGGGLGVDYEGTRSRSFCSVNYSLEEFARTVVRGVWEGCDAAGLSHPRIVTEAGRAMTAHHAVLISDAIDVDRPDDTVPTDPGENAPFVLRDLYTAYREHSGRSPVELYHEATHWLAEARGMYLHGVLDLEQRAQAEQLHVAICQGILPRLRSDAPSDREVLETLNGQLAEKVFCNFSLFQSLPDVWAIDQIFPIVPLRGLDRAPSRSVVIEDLTCDSDGRIDHYAGELGISDVLPLPNKDQGERQVLGFFLVGAYQETLGDIHNLFGDTHSVSVRCQGDGQWTIEDVSEGDSISQVLSQVGYDPGDVIQRIRRKCAADPDGGADQLLESLEATLLRGTYLSR